MPEAEKPTDVVADYDYGDVDIERAIIEHAGLELVAAQCKNEDDVIAAGREADALIAQYAPISGRVIDALENVGSSPGTGPASTSST